MEIESQRQRTTRKIKRRKIALRNNTKQHNISIARANEFVTLHSVIFDRHLEAINSASINANWTVMRYV